MRIVGIDMTAGRVVLAIAAWSTLACVMAMVLTAAVGARTASTELASQVLLFVSLSLFLVSHKAVTG